MADEIKNVPELTITCFFKAPVEFIWQAWTDPDLMKTLVGPKDF